MRILAIEPHLPFQHPHMMRYVEAMKKEFKLDMLVVHDICDQYIWSHFDKDPEAMNCVQELMEARGEIRKLAKLFPRAIVIRSNHESRVIKRALNAGLPASMLKSMREILELPGRWEYKEEIEIDKVLHSHGERFGNGDAKIALSVDRRNQCLGHFHTRFGITYVSNSVETNWVMNIAAMIDIKAYAFQYIKNSKFFPVIGGGLILDGVPQLAPLIL